MLELNDRFLPFYEKKARYKIAYGGRSGSKSHNIAVLLLMKGSEKPLLIACLREYQKNLRDSVYRLLCNKIRQDEYFTYFYRIMADRIVGINGTEFTFSGIKNAVNFKSFEGADIAWIEEAQSLSEESVMILIPTIRKPSCELWFSYNPDSAEDPVHKQMLNSFVIDDKYINELVQDGILNDNDIEELKQFDCGQINLQINYTENPHCPAMMKLEAKKMEREDYELFRHVWLGETRSISEAVIFKGKFEVLDFKLENYFGIPRFNGEVMDLFYGLDFGWVHPTAIIETFRYRGDIYITQEIVGSEMDLDDIVMRIDEEMPWSKTKIIYGDSASPALISQLQYPRMSKEGVQLRALRIEPANKGQGSVESGITWLKTHKKIYVHPSCTHTINNLKKYCYKKDKNDIITTSIQKIDDDCIDALRYAYSPIISEGVTGVDWSDQEFISELIRDY